MHKFLIVVLLHSSLFAWWDAGHMVVAQIAYERLDSKVKTKVDRYINVMGPVFPNSASFVTAACWADDIRSLGLKVFSPWHGSSLPYDPEGILSTYQVNKLKKELQGRDLVYALEQCVTTFTHPRASSWAKGLMLRFMIHCGGDIHQPLHCTTLYNSHFPNGDRAGTRFRIAGGTNLHGYWDSICGLGTWRLRRPLDDDGIRYINDLAQHATELYPEESFPELEEEADFTKWRDESFEIAATYAYSGVQPGKGLSPKYRATAEQIALQQIALAGYRLARVLNSSLAPLRRP